MCMSLSSIQLDAFLAVCRTRSFTAAAELLHVTQSALSQRIKNLEDDLGATLFTRDPSGATPTELGQNLLKFCITRESLEREFVDAFKSTSPQDLRGHLRLAAFSTVATSLVLPAVAKLLQKHPHVNLEIQTVELRELPGLLTSGRADFALTNDPIHRQGVKNELLGYERNVLIQSKTKQARAHVYLDHDENDQTTLDFFRHHGKEPPKSFRRSYLGKIDAILAGVQLGLGRAVAPRHLIENLKGIEVVRGFPDWKIPVHIAYLEQPFYTGLHATALKALSEEIAANLK